MRNCRKTRFADLTLEVTCTPTRPSVTHQIRNRCNAVTWDHQIRSWRLKLKSVYARRYQAALVADLRLVKAWGPSASCCAGSTWVFLLYCLKQMSTAKNRTSDMGPSQTCPWCVCCQVTLIVPWLKLVYWLMYLPRYEFRVFLIKNCEAES